MHRELCSKAFYVSLFQLVVISWRHLAYEVFVHHPTKLTRKRFQPLLPGKGLSYAGSLQILGSDAVVNDESLGR